MEDTRNTITYIYTFGLYKYPTYSQDILSNIFLGFIHNEWLNEWYEHSEQWMNLEYYAETLSLGRARLYRKDSLQNQSKWKAY